MNRSFCLQIEKKYIDNFTPERTLGVPHCHFNFCWKSDLPPMTLNKKILILGANKPNDFFRVRLPHITPPGIYHTFSSLVIYEKVA